MTPEHLKKLREGREAALKRGPKPLLVSEEDKKRLLEFVKKGYTTATCLKLIGISEHVFKRLLGSKDFVRSFNEAESIFLASVQDKLIDSACSSIDGARYLLERRMDEFNLKSKMDINDSRPLSVVIKRYTPKAKKSK